eukprot:jgi/Bigna1/92833/estExt_fgenesh1_pm.C_790003
MIIVTLLRHLKGHYGKISAMQWGSEETYNLVSASQDGKLIVWDAYFLTKVHVIPLRSTWVMTCAFSPTQRFAASGGLDNLCTVYPIPETQGEYSKRTPRAELSGHDGYLSSCHFLNDNKMLTSSGDQTCILWDVEQKTRTTTFTGHSLDVMCIAHTEANGTFVSGSCDRKAILWDSRSKDPKVQTFAGHSGDVNSVDFFPTGRAFATASEDSTCRLYDIRAAKQIQKYGDIEDTKNASPVTSIAFSRTGSHLFAGYGSARCSMWDTKTAKISQDIQDHEDRISTLGINKRGDALCTGGWDMELRIYSS